MPKLIYCTHGLLIILKMDFICEFMSFCGSNIAQNNPFLFSSEEERDLGKEYGSISNSPREKKF